MNQQETTRLLEKYNKLVERTVGIAHRHSPFHTKDEYRTEAVLALIRLYSNYHMKCDEEFFKLAVCRLRGACFDYMRAVDMISRKGREKGYVMLYFEEDAEEYESRLSCTSNVKRVDEQVDDAWRRRAVTNASVALGERDRLVLKLLLQCNADKDVAEEMGFSDARISQLKKRIVHKLRGRMELNMQEKRA